MFGSPSRWHVLCSFLMIALVAACTRDQSPTAPATSATPMLSSIGFSSSGDMLAGRSDHIAVRLLDGRILVAGGRTDARIGLATAELYDPATGTWTATGSMTAGRFAHTAALLPNGRVLVVGGVSFSFDCADPPISTSAELYDPKTGTWTRTGNLSFGRATAVAVVLADGRVLVAGGGRCGVMRNQAEIYDPATGGWTNTGSMNVARGSPAGVRLADGRVLVAGGTGVFPFASLASAEVYDPATGAWTSTGAMHDPRVWTSDDESAANFLMPLPDGRIFTAGGLNRCQQSGCDLAFLASAEVFDPASGSWSTTGSLATGRYRHQMAVLPDGRVLAAGGRTGSALVGSAELYDPTSGTFSDGGLLVTPRQDYPATPLGDGRVLLSGGQGPTGVLHTSELYTGDRPPVANAGPNVTGFEGTAVQFDGTGSADPDGDALTYSWNFGDGSAPETIAQPSHVYADNGTYTVTLTVSDGSLTAVATTTANIANVAPALSAITGANLTDGGTYTASGSFTDPGADTWTATVDFGDGSGVQPLTLTGKTFSLTHVYAGVGPGPFTVTVTVQDDDGGTGSATASVAVKVNRAPVANAGPNVTGSEGAAVHFDGTGSSDPDGDALTYSWNFGDGSTGSGPMPSHAYADNGTYTVTLTVSDGALANSAVITAAITNVAPVVSAIPGAALSGGESYAASGSFTDPGADSWTATVDYGDGSGVQPLALSGKTFTLDHAYRVSGTFTVTVSVRDDDGGLGTAHAQIVVQLNRAPVANAGPAVTGAEGSAVHFDGTGSSDPDGDALTYSWTFGDGATGSGPTPSHVYTDNGTYTVTLIVSDGSLTAPAATTASIANVAPAVSAIAGAALLPGDTYTAAGAFTDPGADSWTATVDYGDGSGVQPLALVGKSFSLSHTYRAGGTFTVTVTVRDDDGGVGTSQATVAVQTLQQAVAAMEQTVRDLQGAGILNPPTANNWQAALDGVLSSINAGDYAGAISRLQSFISKVQALVSKGRLSAADAQLLLGPANRLLQTLQRL